MAGTSTVDAAEGSLCQYLKDIAETRPLSAQEELELASRIQGGDLEARDKLVEANLRFVVSIAREYQSQEIPLSDLISAGNLGLITAAERFDPSFRVKFISYAVWWIRQSIVQTLHQQSRIVRLPMNRIELLRQVCRYSKKREQETSSLPTNEEIAQELGVSIDYLEDTLVKSQHILSLDTCFSDDDQNNLLRKIPDENQEPSDTLTTMNSLKESIDAILNTLDEREREIIKLYFGLDNGQPMNLAEIGSIFGLTRERIRQIRDKTLSKLRYPSRAQKLVSYMEEIG